jgi:hypothetical protein
MNEGCDRNALEYMILVQTNPIFVIGCGFICFSGLSCYEAFFQENQG